MRMGFMIYSIWLYVHLFGKAVDLRVIFLASGFSDAESEDENELYGKWYLVRSRVRVIAPTKKVDAGAMLPAIDLSDAESEDEDGL